MTNSGVFKTSSADLAAFLIYSEEELLELCKHPNHSHVIEMSFKDPYGKCLDLERVFLHSEIKKYRECHKWLLSKIHRELKSS